MARKRPDPKAAAAARDSVILDADGDYVAGSSDLRDRLRGAYRPGANAKYGAETPLEAVVRKVKSIARRAKKGTS